MNLIRSHLLNIKTYEVGKPIQEVKRELGFKKIIKLASNENLLGASPKVQKAVAREIKNIHYYPESSCYALRARLLKIWKLKKENFFFGNGSNELLILIGLAFLNQDDEVIFSEESFIIYQTVVTMTQAKARVAKARNHTHDLKAFARLLTKRTKLIFICNPNNPTGSAVKRSELLELMKKVPKNCIVVFDEAYGEYVLNNKDFGWGQPFLFGKIPCIVLRTFSKFYGLAGLRIGYGVARKEIVDAIERVRQPFNVDHLAQTAATVSLSDLIYQKKVLSINEKGKAFFYSELDKMGLEYVRTYANFVFIGLPINGRDAFERLLKKGVIVRPLFANYIRVTIGGIKENTAFFKVLKHIL